MSHFESRKEEVLLGLPTVGLLSLLIVIPFIGMTIASFSNLSNVSNQEPYYQIIFSYSLLKSVIKTFSLAFLGSITSVSLSIPICYYMLFCKNSVRITIISMMISAFCSGLLIRVFSWKVLLHPEGFFKLTFYKFGLVNSGFTFLYNDFAILFVIIDFGIPLAFLPIYSQCEDFNISIIESASDLGASRFQSFIKIFLPYIRNGIFQGYVLVFLTVVSSPIFSELVGGTSNDLMSNKIVRKFLIEKNCVQGCIISSVFSTLIFSFVLVSYFIYKKICSDFD